MSGNVPSIGSTGDVVLFDADRKQRFLTLYRLTGQLQRSARESGISPATVRNHLKSDLDFKAACDEAYRDFKESIESEVMRRAIMGWEEPVYQQGMLAGTVRKFSERLLELFAKRHIQEYKEKVDLNLGTGGGLLVVPAPQSDKDWTAAHAAEEIPYEEVKDDEAGR